MPAARKRASEQYHTFSVGRFLFLFYFVDWEEGLDPGGVCAPVRVFKTAFEDFCNRAKAYRERTGHCAVLVIDNINRLALSNPQLLQHLQDMAKDAADSRMFITVFVTSEGQAPIQMLARSARSRLGKMLAVGDMSHDEVLDLLCEKQGKPIELAENIYGLVGGRIKLIEAIVSELDEGVSWPEVEHLVLKDAMNSFEKVKMLDGGEYRDVGFQIAKHIIQHGRMHWREFLRIAGGTEVEEILLSSNVFATVPRSDWITFQSKPTEHVARALLSEMETEQKGKKARVWW
ncbi:hypothetical protein C7212DRAFT_362923 [Tuber magnatum]|uniref:ATPase AAA-type core domain-containing protein n=1 Tax=Tuber magnatum TaxID=42249 RepID=A0A317SYT2_9PEZI|nr:hypothetical protein C7212DRAFT_362923 [Tuber magnatum]